MACWRCHELSTSIYWLLRTAMAFFALHESKGLGRVGFHHFLAFVEFQALFLPIPLRVFLHIPSGHLELFMQVHLSPTFPELFLYSLASSLSDILSPFSLSAAGFWCVLLLQTVFLPPGLQFWSNVEA